MTKSIEILQHLDLSAGFAASRSTREAGGATESDLRQIVEQCGGRRRLCGQRQRVELTNSSDLITKVGNSIQPFRCPARLPKQTVAFDAAQGDRRNLVDETNGVPPDREVSRFFTAKWIAVKVRHDSGYEVFRDIYHESRCWVLIPATGWRASFCTEPSTTEKRLANGKNRQIVCSQAEDKAHSWGAAVVQSQVKASFAVSQTRQPVSESIAVDVGGERLNRMIGSHDALLYQQGSLWSGPSGVTSTRAARSILSPQLAEFHIVRGAI